MNDVKKMTMAQLIETAVSLKNAMDNLKAELEQCSAEIQARAVSYIEDRNIKFTEFYGNNCLAGVTVAQKVEIMNITTFMDAVGYDVASTQLTREQQATKYKMNSEFQRACVALVNDDYCSDMTLEDLIDKAGWDIDAKKRRLLLKKLKGDYLKDKETLKTIDGIPDDVDEELYFIYQIKNWLLISKYFSHIKDLEQVKVKLRSCLFLDETVKVSWKEVIAG